MNSSDNKSRIQRLGIFCGSAEGTNPAFGAAAAALGALLSESGIGLVYGGARVGIMGIVADAVMSSGGEVIGIIYATSKDRKAVGFATDDTELRELIADRSVGGVANGQCP